ncbi:hypothetical protein ONE63_005113 [Megalurothrips usitatus]|uniref:DUF7869 domain-containing protein n=1 Tax=Megalurothrips usitatus TaxID=439358 RepID=A0AAV7XUB8_9NEOP|nr:hypothetical protein ONE63_005113 [Megalurothrips usitatus]
MTVDLEKVFLCPKGENSEFFYKRKVSCYNFSIFVSGEQKGFAYVWDQTEAKRGSAEITSCLWDFISKKVESGIKVFRIYSDNCSAQNKNQFLFSMYVMASIRYSIKIIHRYLEPGHTHMEVDSMHATIENSHKFQDIFVPKDWYNCIKLAKKTLPKYDVIELKQHFIFDSEPLAVHQRWNQLGISTFKEVHLSFDEPGTARFKREYEGELQTATVIKKKPGRPVNWKTICLKKRYASQIPLKELELQDLQALCRSGAIPSKYHDFDLDYLPTLNEKPENIPPDEVLPEFHTGWSDEDSSGNEDDPQDPHDDQHSDVVNENLSDSSIDKGDPDYVP